VLECVVNVSEGRDANVLDALSVACAPALLDVHADPDHHRSVFTLAHAHDDTVTEAAVRALARAVDEHVGFADHRGVHPRLGAVDVVPFVALAPTEPAAAVAAARSFGAWLDTELAVPVFFYDAADERHRTLPVTRREAFLTRLPDLGAAHPNARLGACAVGARPPLVAINVELDRDDLALARAVAREVREIDGGLPGVRALGLVLASRGHAQVSMNLVDLHATGVENACTTVRELLAAAGAGVERVELVGLIPAAELARCSEGFRRWSALDESLTVEARVARAGAA
jgi:glutamate formiminotransferase